MEDKSLIHLIHLVEKEIRNYIRGEVKEYKFSHGELPFLAKLIKDGDGVIQKKIYDDLSISKATASKMINSLVQKGYLRKQKDPEDRRATKVYLTERKDEVKEVVEEIDEKIQELVLKDFTTEEKKDLVTYLTKMLTNLKEQQ